MGNHPMHLQEAVRECPQFLLPCQPCVSTGTEAVPNLCYDRATTYADRLDTAWRRYETIFVLGLGWQR